MNKIFNFLWERPWIGYALILCLGATLMYLMSQSILVAIAYTVIGIIWPILELRLIKP